MRDNYKALVVGFVCGGFLRAGTGGGNRGWEGAPGTRVDFTFHLLLAAQF